MAFGGGTFNLKNKALPGAYINFVSASKANITLSERGRVCMPLTLSWGKEGEFFEVTQEEFFKNSLKIFGYEPTELKGLYDLFKNAKTGVFYRVNGGTKATSTIAEAKFSGARGNDLRIIATNDELRTYLGDKLVATQDFEAVENDYVIFTGPIQELTDYSFKGGSDGEISYDDFFLKAESESFNILANTDVEQNEQFVEFTKNMRDTLGVKFQTVLYRCNADYEGVVSVENTVSEGDESSLVYFTAGILASCDVNKTALNKVYDGMFQVVADYSQKSLETMIKEGKFIYHKVGGEYAVLSDINTLVSGNEDLKNNQVIRVLDQIGNDIAVIFKTQFLGKVLNDNAGRISLWNAIVTHHRALSDLRAIEDFSPENVVVEKGDSKNSVVVTDTVFPVCAMAKLYMTVIVE